MARPTPTMDDNRIQRLSDTVVTCCLCNLVFDEGERHPRLLPCLHSACNRCLEKKNKSKECITCMHCKTEYDLSKCPVTIFPKDDTKIGVLRLFRLKNAEETIKCQECEDELLAQFHCETCSKQLCNDCHQYHRRAKRSHVVSCLQNIPFTLVSAKIFDTRGKCHVSGHEVENLDYYCKKCDIAICSRCVCTIHKEVNGHQTENVCDVYENKKQALISDQLVMENRMSQIDKTIKMIETEIPNIDINSDIASDEIKHTFERVYRMLKDKENDMLKDLKLQAKKKNICLQEQNVKLLSQKQNMADAANFLEASLVTSDHSSLLSIAPLIYNRLSYLASQAVDSAPCAKACVKFVEFNWTEFPLNVGRLVSPSVYGPRTRILLPELLYAGEEIAMSLELYDYGGNTVDTAELQVCVDVLKDDKSCLFDNPVSCVQKKPGTWSCLLNIQLPGKYEAKVSVFGVKLETSPIILDVDTVPVIAAAQIPVNESSKSIHKRVEDCSPKRFPDLKLLDVCKTIEVKNILHQSDNDIKSYFESLRLNSGGLITNYQRFGDVAYITFQDEKVCDRICMQKHNYEIRQLYTEISNDIHIICEISTGPNATKVDFIQNAPGVRKSFEDKLRDIHADIRWPSKVNKNPSICCTLKTTTKDYQTLSKQWTKKVKRFIDEFFNEINSIQICIQKDKWVLSMKELQQVNVSHPEDVAIVVKSEKSCIYIVGYSEAASVLHVQLKELLKKV